VVDRKVVTKVRTYLRAVEAEGIPVSFGVIFGSWVTGGVDQWSDIDLLVISPRFDDGRTRPDIALLWRLAARIDSRIEPIPCGELQWVEDASSHVVEVARREGERVEPDVEAA